MTRVTRRLASTSTSAAVPSPRLAIPMATRKCWNIRKAAAARFMLLVFHDDAAREYAYGPAMGLPDPKLGAFTQALYDQAKKEGWTVASMKNDWSQVFPFEQSPVTAIDILLEPDATMLRHAEAVNASQLKIFPQGFALDAAHRPHITTIQ